MARHIYSTLAASVAYTEFSKGKKPGEDFVPVALRSVTIKGGAGVASKHLITPHGVHTEVSDEEYEFLKDEPVFKLHQENGHIKVEEKKYDVEKVVADMLARDNSAPLVDADFEPGKAPVQDKKAEHVEHASTTRNNQSKRGR